MALVEALTAWAPQAAEALPAWVASGEVKPPWAMQLTAGYCCLSTLAAMASRLGVQPGTAFRIAAACQLVFGVGQSSIAIATNRAEADAATRQQPSEPTLGLLAALSAVQLQAVASCVTLLRRDQWANAAAAFARSTAKPAALVPWLVKVSRAVLALRGWVMQFRGIQGTRVLRRSTRLPGAVCAMLVPCGQTALPPPKAAVPLSKTAVPPPCLTPLPRPPICSSTACCRRQCHP